MLKELKTITLTTLLVLATAKLGSTAPLPTPNNQGDYTGRAYHTYWEVVDPDPNGLNCRMTNSSFEELMRVDNRTPFEFFNWSVIGVLKQGQRFESFPSNAAGTFRDTRGLPWLFVGKNYATGGVQRCFIRANSQFVKPVQMSSTRVQPQASQPLTSSTALPMKLGFDEGFGSIVVPESNTTASAYGGRLRRYDVHIAKMFEVTYFMCQQGNLRPGITWNYEAGGGTINMGSFEITCRLANQIVSAYSLGKSEPTNITFSAGETGRADVRSFNIPVLDITGDKVPRWISFVQGFQPVRR
ncbi:hypothetical protein [Kamptonema sp. UHCC 0994]|uniref:hypothetical protein n=1 Tax=Kamptonema sp. UHCC 0994 TaxID=3031329 RepID=UPI0023BA47CB|nr:hypothetical protein [Kamptonema sp. UHCC 0994]MDF0556516.1 hypothetical protein [Kamptonema sp. UHCC 0994]